MSGIENLKNTRVNLPFIGTIGIVGMGIGALVIYLLFFRKGRLTSKTITTRFR